MCPSDSTYRRTGVTYAQLHRALSSLGVSWRRVDGDPPVNAYEHRRWGVLVTLAAYPEHELVLGHHLAALRVLLDNFGIADTQVLETALQKAG